MRHKNECIYKNKTGSSQLPVSKVIALTNPGIKPVVR